MEDVQSALSAPSDLCTVSMPTLPFRKRKKAATPDDSSSNMKVHRTSVEKDTSGAELQETKEDIEKITKEIRLEQNRRAARETRRRKKIMVEELQRSVLHFSRANSIVKMQNDEFERLLLDARSQISLLNKAGTEGNSKKATTYLRNYVKSNQDNEVSDYHGKQQRAKEVQEAIASAKAQAQAMSLSLPSINKADATRGIALQAFYESQGFSPAAARAVSHIDPKYLNTNFTPGSLNTIGDAFSLSSIDPPSSLNSPQVLSELLKEINPNLISPAIPPVNPYLSLLEAVKINQTSMMSSQMAKSLEQLSTNPFLLNAALIFAAATTGQMFNPHLGQNLAHFMQNDKHENTKVANAPLSPEESRNRC